MNSIKSSKSTAPESKPTNNNDRNCGLAVPTTVADVYKINNGSNCVSMINDPSQVSDKELCNDNSDHDDVECENDIDECGDENDFEFDNDDVSVAGGIIDNLCLEENTIE